MKKIMIAAFMALTLNQVSAQNMNMRDAFRQMPDSIMPYLTKNNRLDFIDFLDSGMRAEVKNKLGGTSEMLTIANDSLTIKMSPSMHVDMLLLDSTIVMIETFTVDSIYGQSKVSFYNTNWQQIDAPTLTEVQMKRIKCLEMQNILKRDDEILNKR